jgi:hypothetical protein
MELIKIVIYLKNRSPIKSLLNTISWKSLYKEKSDLSNLRIIGSLVYYHNVETEISPNRRTKSDPKTYQKKLIKYNKELTQYRI